MANDERLKTLIPFLQAQGFVWGPEPEIYGGLAGFYTYGPSGTLLKRRVEQKIRDIFARNGLFEVEVPTVLPKAVWEASGHLGGFTDPLIKDAKGNTYRADKIIEDHYAENGITEPVSLEEKDLLGAIEKHNIPCPSGEKWVMEIANHSLMMQTTVGTDAEAYNRPETATATYLPFLRYAEHFRKKLPFGVYQIGKAYRNEISPRQHLLRMREFTQAEAQLFIDPEAKDTFESFNAVKEDKIPIFSWKQQESGSAVEQLSVMHARNTHFSSNAYAYTIHLAYTLFASFGIPEDRIRLRQHGPTEKAFYAADAWDVEINLPTFGWTEVCGVHDRTDYDLGQHAKHSGKQLTIYNEEKKEHVIPHVLEIAFGVDRPVYALLDIYYDEKEASAGKTMLTLPYALAPVDVAVLPLVKKLSGRAKEVYRQLQDAGFICVYDEAGSIGKRYLRQSVIGTPKCVTIDFDTVEGGDNPKDTVTVRDRDTEEQTRVPISELAQQLRAH